MSISDKEFYHLTISINKALNPMEAPLKIKHARFVIITTHRTKECKSFWAVVTRQPLMENRFTAWKFCHLLHKILREGHESSIIHAQTHKKMILEMGKLWGHLQDGVGHCIQSYSKLIVTKLDFHEKNAHFPGSLIIDFREIAKYSGGDINMYFQLCVEIFDYLDDIIDVQLKVFTSINTYRMSSMTPQGQCRLAPLITLIQDANPLYDLSVRLMFKLHEELPNDILIGHRDRFRDMFQKVKIFYDNVRPLQYFADLIQVPHLPETAPNFSSKVDFGSYMPPVVVVPQEPEPNIVVENLVDINTLEVQSIQTEESRLTEKLFVYENIIKEKEKEISRLQANLSELRDFYNTEQYNHQKEVKKLEEEIIVLNAELVDAKELSTNIRVVKDELELKLQETPTLLQKVCEEEEKLKASEEKFNKLKTMYTQIRDEHINLLRQHGETTKTLNKINNDNSDLSRKNAVLRVQLDECLASVKSKEEIFNDERLQLDENFKEMCIKNEKLNENFEKLQIDYQNLQSTKQEESHILSDKNIQLISATKELNEFKTKIQLLEECVKNAEEHITKKELEHVKKIKNLEKNLINKVNEALAVEQEQKDVIKNNLAEIQEMKLLLNKMEKITQEKEIHIEQITKEKACIEDEREDLLKKNAEVNLLLNNSQQELESSKLHLNKTISKLEILNRSMMKTMIKTLQTAFNGASIDDSQSFENMLTSFKNIDIVLNELCNSHRMFYSDKNEIEGLTTKIIQTASTFYILRQNCILICNNTTFIKQGQDILSELNALADAFINLYDAIYHSLSHEEADLEVWTIRQHLDRLHLLVEDLRKSSNTSIDLGDLVEIELREMDKAIEEATGKIADMLSSARIVDSGIKLEVNEKILDSCTNLMESIKMLIQKSKILQEEILSLNRGKTTIKEFYKRNSQWSEGLISASKSVAKGANMLLEAANKAVSGESKNNFEIIVAAQEIAACTAQLVVASKVKAPRESQKLVDLTKASRNVSQATGAVVATVKDCNQQLDMSQELDLSKLTSNQAKTLEMDIIVKVLELEQALQVERSRLSAFRRQNYQNNDN